MGLENHPLIGILVTKRNSRKRILELYQRYHNLNLKLCAFTPADILWEEQRIIGVSLKKGIWKQRSFPFPHVVYNRCYNKKLITIQRLEEAIGRNKCFNNINFFNKWDLYNLLKKSNLNPYVPDTFLYHEVNIFKVLDKYKLVYIKPSYGLKGRSVYRVELTDNGDIHISMHSLAPRNIYRRNEGIQEKLDELLGLKQYMVQQGIRMRQLDHQYFDIRVLVQKGIIGEWAVSTITCRVAYKHYFNTSMCETIYDVADILPQLFSPEETNEILQSLYEVSVTAAQEAETYIGTLGELSVDFVLDEQRKLWIIELNGKPQKSIYEDLKSVNRIIYSRPLEYAYYLSQS
ncbi:YheC/YheD family protein [Paenibacillus sp. N1-5-1-14]|uniref:YheC/YheD family endospore coat-associated protein n=1 Tax=Paenibacillus radicibacter TaxID=2972488 RepID=UPI002158DD6B|nr:YheC/YheD family protein [Paenibacillus radicibacter]MCR8645906.1 YheC/YheD family protein [Paenibacillus radicibacter]